MTDDQQRNIVNLYHKLDSVAVRHNDANPLNLMCRAKKGAVPERWFLIDYGFSTKLKQNLSNIVGLDFLIQVLYKD